MRFREMFFFIYCRVNIFWFLVYEPKRFIFATLEEFLDTESCGKIIEFLSITGDSERNFVRTIKSFQVLFRSRCKIWNIFHFFEYFHHFNNSTHMSETSTDLLFGNPGNESYLLRSKLKNRSREKTVDFCKREPKFSTEDEYEHELNFSKK